jgi:hypothetical protein
MSSLAPGHDLSNAPPTSSGPQAPRAVVDSANAHADTSGSSHDQNPLWLIAGAMALFFVVAAAFLAS